MHLCVRAQVNEQDMQRVCLRLTLPVQVQNERSELVLHCLADAPSPMYRRIPNGLRSETKHDDLRTFHVTDVFVGQAW